MLQNGKKHLVDIKHKKAISELPMQYQFKKYHHKLHEFYQQQRITTVTENQVKEGMSRFNYLVSPQEMSELQAVMEKKKIQAMKKRP